MLTALTLMTFIAAAPCSGVDKVKADVLANIPHSHAVELGGTEAKAFIAAYNTIPPASKLEADYLLTISAEAQPGVVVVLFTGGCATHMFGVSVTRFKKLLQGL